MHEKRKEFMCVRVLLLIFAYHFVLKNLPFLFHRPRRNRLWLRQHRIYERSDGWFQIDHFRFFFSFILLKKPPPLDLPVSFLRRPSMAICRS